MSAIADDALRRAVSGVELARALLGPEHANDLRRIADELTAKRSQIGAPDPPLRLPTERGRRR